MNIEENQQKMTLIMKSMKSNAWKYKTKDLFSKNFTDKEKSTFLLQLSLSAE